VAAKYILAVVAAAFLVAAAVRAAGGSNLSHPQTRTWLLIAAIFGAISAWLFTRT